ncbi:phospholipase D family protein [Aeromonas hydrophila]|uniref:phospholipase D family protein n=1 Tax=Aeromonas TaxID=642 RepID=UPI0022E3A020|nr:phospholipase D family protein [Aeromonas sp. QDB03]
MEIITNSIFGDAQFSRTITDYSEWCEEAKIVTAFFTDDSLIRIMNNNSKIVTLVVSLRPPTSYDALLRVSALKNVDVRFLGKELHSKIYAFKRGTEFKCSIGSSNLTFGGLYDNIETNVIIKNTDAEKCYIHMDRIINQSYPLTASILDEYKSIYQSFKEPEFNSVKPPKISTDNDYNKLWLAIDMISVLVSDELSEYFPDIPKYLVIDHFWHFIVKVNENEHETISKNMRKTSHEKYLIGLFKRFVDWDSGNGEPTKAIFRRAMRFRDLLLVKKNLSDSDILTIFKTLHSTHSRSQRFAHDIKFLNENPRDKIIKSMRHLVDENVELDKRTEDLSNTPYSLKHFGTSAIREFNGWCYPEKYPIRNEKADKALEILGYW